MNYYNNAGDKTDLIEISQTPPLAVELGQKVKTHSIIPMISYFGKNKILDARWGVLVLPMVNNPNASIALDFYSHQSLAGKSSIDLNSFGVGDLYLQPVWLTWEKKKIAASFSYGAWIPLGKYKANDAENIGLGYWSHNFRAMVRFKPKDKFSFISGVTYEINSKQQGTDFEEAPHLTFDYGGSYNFTMGHEIGFYGYGTWETGNDKGLKAVINHDKIFGLEIYGSYWFIPGKIGALTRFTNTFGTRNRFGGASFQLGINYLIF